MTTTLLILVLLLFAACLLLLYEVVWMHGEALRMQRLAHDNEVTALRLADALGRKRSQREWSWN